MSYQKLKQGEAIPFNESLTIQLIQGSDLQDIIEMLNDDKSINICSSHLLTTTYMKTSLTLLLKIRHKRAKTVFGQIAQRS